MTHLNNIQSHHALQIKANEPKGERIKYYLTTYKLRAGQSSGLIYQS